MYDMTNWHSWLVSSKCVTRLDFFEWLFHTYKVHKRDINPCCNFIITSNVWNECANDYFLCDECFNNSSQSSNGISCMWIFRFRFSDIFICVTWLILLRDMTQSCMWDMTRNQEPTFLLLQGSMSRVLWKIHVWYNTKPDDDYIHVWHNSKQSINDVCNSHLWQKMVVIFWCVSWHTNKILMTCEILIDETRY